MWGVRHKGDHLIPSLSDSLKYCHFLTARGPHRPGTSWPSLLCSRRSRGSGSGPLCPPVDPSPSLQVLYFYLHTFIFYFNLKWYFELLQEQWESWEKSCSLPGHGGQHEDDRGWRARRWTQRQSRGVYWLQSGHSLWSRAPRHCRGLTRGLVPGKGVCVLKKTYLNMTFYILYIYYNGSSSLCQ